MKKVIPLTTILCLLPLITLAQTVQFGTEEVRYNMGPMKVENICKSYSNHNGSCAAWETVRSQQVVSKSICQKRDAGKNCLKWVTIPVE